MRDCGLEGKLSGQSLNFTAKDKLSEEDVQTYKYWYFKRQEEDNFESLVRWLEMRVQIMDEARKETRENGNRKPIDQRSRGALTGVRANSQIYDPNPDQVLIVKQTTRLSLRLIHSQE